MKEPRITGWAIIPLAAGFFTIATAIYVIQENLFNLSNGAKVAFIFSLSILILFIGIYFKRRGL